MFNVMLDELPDSFEGYQIDPSFRIGIQIHQVMEDRDLTNQEKYITSLGLLFPGIFPETVEDQERAIEWFLSEWNHDKSKKSKDTTKVLDYDVDQWRIYSAFKSQYGIDLNTENMHFWVFMGLLTTLDECAFTRVVDIRLKKITPKMGKEEKAATLKAKSIYGLEQPKEIASEDEKQKQQEAIEVFEKMRKAKS